MKYFHDQGFWGRGLSPPPPETSPMVGAVLMMNAELLVSFIVHSRHFSATDFFSIYNVISGTKMIVLKQAFCITDTDVSLMLRLNCRLQLSGNLPMSPPCLPFSGRIYTPWPELPPSFPSPRKHSAKSQTFVPWFVESQAQSVKLHIKCHINQH